MDIHKLHIIGINRDAVASQKGYSYQQLKTLEDWLENRIRNGNDEIYCEFEDDIFAQDPVEGKSTFTQIKLYSKDFSFSSESVINAIENFFSLYVKGEYSFDKLQFNFETNVSVVGKEVKNNDAKLLAEWNENQNDISDELLLRIRIRIKKILDDYVNKRLTSMAANGSTKSDAQQAKIVYDSLTDEHFDLFIKCIRWQFNNEESNEAVEKVIANIKILIGMVPLPLDMSMTEIYFSLLVSQIFQKSIQDDSKDRKLTNNLLDSVLLNAGEEDDKWYVRTLEQFREFDLYNFYPGEFQAALSAGSYCRWKEMDGGHKEFWLDILKQYIDFTDTPHEYKRKATLQYIFLKIQINQSKDHDKKSINVDKDLVDFYIGSWKKEDGIKNLEEDIVFLTLLKTQNNFFSLGYPTERITEWEKEIMQMLNDEEADTINVDKLCEIYELQGHMKRVLNDNYIDGCKESFVLYRRIIPLLDKTHFYTISSLYDQMHYITKSVANHGEHDEILEMTDIFMAEIEEHAAKSGFRHKVGHDYIERGKVHMERQDVSNVLKALELFHKAKDKWRQEYTRKGYMLSLLGISKVYESLGMTYAAKYYSLLAFWTIWQGKDDNLRKYIPKTFAQILNLDFKNGAWINCLSELNLYLMSKREFDERGFAMEGDEEFTHALLNIALMYYASKSIIPDSSAFMENIKSNFGDFWNQFVEPLLEAVSSKFIEDQSLTNILQGLLMDRPYNDVGLFRNIRFKVLSVELNFQFENCPVLVGIAEEFISFIQIELCEIAQCRPGIFNENKSVYVKIDKGHFQKEILGENKWCITLPNFNSKEKDQVNRHYMYLGALANVILRDLTGLSDKEFTNFYMNELLDKRTLGEKVMEAAAFQRVYKKTIMYDSEISKIAHGMTEFNTDKIEQKYINWLSK